MNKILTVSLFLLLPAIFYAQKVSLYGYVTDEQTGEKLIGASVSATDVGKGVSTNSQGYFSLTLPAGLRQIALSYPGYRPRSLEINLTRDTLATFLLSAASVLEEVEITSSAGVNEDRPNALSLPIRQIRAVPALGGEVDVVKVLQRLPGIKMGNEGTTGLFVRGGTPDQNLILLDGIPVYNISHLFGFVSVFNASSISHLDVIKGGFPARYGGRLASVIDIHTKGGNLKSWHGEVEAGIISSKIFVEGPLKKDVCSITASARRSFYEAYTLPQRWLKSDGEFNNLNFYDFNIKINYKLSERDKLIWSSYFGRDALNLLSRSQEDTLKFVNNRRLEWGNSIHSLRWTRLWGERLFSNVGVFSNAYRYSFEQDMQAQRAATGELLDQRLFNFASNIDDLGFIADFSYYPSSRHAIKFGASATAHTFKPGFTANARRGANVENPIDTANAVVNIRAVEARIYAEDNYKITSTLTANLGLHASAFWVQNRQYTSLEPRVSLTQRVGKKASLNAGFTTMQQYLHLLSNSGLGIPADLWVPPTAKVAPQRSWQASVGWNMTPRPGWELGADVYYKSMSNLIDYKPGSSFLIEGVNWEDKVALGGTGTSRGIELFGRKTTGAFTGMAGYTLAWTDRSFADIDNGQPFPFRYDRRHEFQISGMYQFNKRISLSAAWTFSSGNPVTLPVGIYPSLSYPPVPNSFRGIGRSSLIDVDYPGLGGTGVQEGIIVLDYGRKNNQRMPDYHRLDLSVQFTKQKKRGERTWGIQVYNVYNQINPYFVRFNYTDVDFRKPLNSRGQFEVVSLFQIIPSVSYAYKF